MVGGRAEQREREQSVTDRARTSTPTSPPPTLCPPRVGCAPIANEWVKKSAFGADPHLAEAFDSEQTDEPGARTTLAQPNQQRKIAPIFLKAKARRSKE